MRRPAVLWGATAILAALTALVAQAAAQSTESAAIEVAVAAAGELPPAASPQAAADPLQEEASDAEEALTGDDEDEVIDLGEISAVGTRSLAGRLGQRAALTVVELDAGQPGLSLVSVLEALPGVDVRQSGGSGQLMVAQVRGARGNQVLVLLDGQALTPGQTADLSQVSVASLVRVELLRGAEAARFGPGALGGVLNLVTRRPEPPAAEPSPDGSAPISETFSERLKPTGAASPGADCRAGLTAASFGNIGSSFLWQDAATTVGLALSQSENDFPFTRAGGGKATRLNNEARALSAWAAGSGERDWRLCLSSLERGVPGSAEFPTLAAEYRRAAAHLAIGAPDAALRWGFSLSKEEFDDPHPYLGGVPIRNRSDRLQFSLAGGAPAAAQGIGWAGTLDAVDSTEYGGHQRFSLRSGWSRESRHGQASLAANASVGVDSEGLLPPSLSLSVSRPLGRQATAYASTGYRYRRPDFEELYATGQGSLQGNPDLRAESCASVELGAQVQSALSSFQCALFADQYADSILFIPVSAYVVRASNTGRARVIGAEAGWRSSSGPLHWDSSFTWLPWAEFASGIPLVGRARLHSANRLAYDYCGEARPGRYVAATFDYNGSMTADLFGNLRIPPRGIAGLELGAEVGRAGISISVNNLFDRQARDLWHYPLPGREYRFSLKLDL